MGYRTQETDSYHVHLSIYKSNIKILITHVFFSTEAYVWRKESQEILKNALNRKLNTNVAKNVILFIGDGMGVSTVTAARILRGQKQGRPGEETILEFEKFPHVALSKVNLVHMSLKILTLIWYLL